MGEKKNINFVSGNIEQKKSDRKVCYDEHYINY